MLSNKQRLRMEAKAYRREKRRLRAELYADPTNFEKLMRYVGQPFARHIHKYAMRDRPLLSFGGSDSGCEIPAPRTP